MDYVELASPDYTVFFSSKYNVDGFHVVYFFYYVYMLTRISGDNFYLRGALRLPSFKYIFSAFIHVVLYELTGSRMKAQL